MPAKAKDGGGNGGINYSAPRSGVLRPVYSLSSCKEYSYVFQINQTERQLIKKYKNFLIDDAAHFAEITYDILFSNPDIAKVLYQHERDGGNNARLIQGLLNHLYLIIDDHSSQRNLDEEKQFILSLVQAGIKPSWVIGCYCSLLDHLKSIISGCNEISCVDKDQLLSILIRMVFKCSSMTSDICWEAVLDSVNPEVISSVDTGEKRQSLVDALPQCLWTVETASDEISYFNTTTANAFKELAGPVPGFDLMTLGDQSRVKHAWNKAKQGEKVQLAVSLSGSEQQIADYRLSFYPGKKLRKKVGQVQCMLDPIESEIWPPADLDRLYASTHHRSEGHSDSYQIDKGQICRAIEKGQFELCYQPNIRADDGKISSVEALIRWHHPEVGVIQPNDFIPLVEASGLMESVTRWVMLTALMDSKSWPGENAKIPVSINLSGQLLKSGSLSGLIKEVLSETGSSCEKLQVEISDRDILADYPCCATSMLGLKAIGIQVAIDDFGTGQLAFNCINDFPAQILKIDHLFMEPLSSSPQNDTLVRSMIDLGHNLGCKVVGEGVESQEVFDSLNQLGCDFMQGFHITQPLSSAMLADWMLSGSRHQPQLN
ncbi:MAG: EAL domain-containing protein [Gammaproteobacteria bacterium]